MMTPEDENPGTASDTSARADNDSAASLRLMPFRLRDVTAKSGAATLRPSRAVQRRRPRIQRTIRRHARGQGRPRGTPTGESPIPGPCRTPYAIGLSRTVIDSSSQMARPPLRTLAAG